MPQTSRRWSFALAAVGSAALCLAIAGCGGGAAGGSSPASAASGGGSVTIRATDLKFDPGSIKIGGPGSLTITLDNKGAIEHDFVIEGVQGDKLAVPPGKSGTATFKVPKAGTYTFSCSVQGHKDAGMKGTLIVG